MSANIKASTDGTQAIIGVGGVDQMTVSNAGVVTANSFVGLNSNIINIRNFGADPTGVVDSTTAIQNAINTGKTIFLPTGTYKYSYLQFNVPSQIIGNGILYYDGSTPLTGTASIQINSSLTAESLRISSSGVGEIAFDYIQASSSNINIGLLELNSNVQRNVTGGTNFYGSNIFIDKVITKNIARPIAFQPLTGTTIRQNIHVGSLIADNYIRGLALSYVNNWSVNSVFVKTRWSGVLTMTPGYNGVLLQGCNDWTMGELYIADAPEHSFRIGGAANTTDFSIGQITSVNSSGCAMKFNVDVGYLAKNGQVGQLIGINTGEGSALGNKEVARITRVENINIGSIAGYVFVTRCLAAQDVENLNVGSIYAENVQARVVQTESSYDSSTGNVNGLYIDNVTAYMNPIARAAFDFSYASGSRTIGNVIIGDSFVTGFSNFLCTADALNIYSGPIFLNARSLSTDAVGGVENIQSTNSLFQLNYTRGTSTYKGKAFDYSSTAENTINQTQFVNTSSVTSDQKAALFLRSNVTPNINTYGAGLAFSRLNSERRGAAIVAKQTGNDVQNMGISFLCAAVNAGTDFVAENMTLKHTGVLNLVNLPTSSAGLVTGDLWRNGNVINIV